LIEASEQQILSKSVYPDQRLEHLMMSCIVIAVGYVSRELQSKTSIVCPANDT
jgi:hypothetical protein